MSGIVVPLGGLRRALVAVRPFADPKDKTGRFKSIRLIPGDDMHVTATNRYAAALARVEIAERWTAAADFIDLDLASVKKILDVFQMPGENAEVTDALLRIEVTDQETVFTDASGFIDGDSLSLQLVRYDTPDVRRVFTTDRLHRSAPLLPGDPDYGLVGDQATRFATVLKAYGLPVIFHGRKKATHDGAALDVIATCGPDFLAYFTTPTIPHPERDWRIRWANELHHQALADTARNVSDEDLAEARAALPHLFRVDAGSDTDTDHIDGQEELPLDSPTRDRDDVGGYPLRSID